MPFHATHRQSQLMQWYGLAAMVWSAQFSKGAISISNMMADTHMHSTANTSEYR